MVELHRDPKGEISWQRSKDNLAERYHVRDSLRTTSNLILNL